MDKPEDDELYRRALDVAQRHGRASVSFIQRQLRIGYNRAARLVQRMEREGRFAAKPLMPWASVCLRPEPSGMILDRSNLPPGRDVP